MKAYTGIGSRETPPDVLRVMESVAQHLAYTGWTLRSGSAQGADSAFERGAWNARDSRGDRVPRPELYLPWPRFEERRSVLVRLERPTRPAYDIAAEHHPAWGRLSEGARALHARNVHQVLGPDVTNPVLSRFVICWTRDGAGGGGTGQALRIAKHYGVPVFDLAIPAALERVLGLFDA